MNEIILKEDIEIGKQTVMVRGVPCTTYTCFLKAGIKLKKERGIVRAINDKGNGIIAIAPLGHHITAVSKSGELINDFDGTIGMMAWDMAMKQFGNAGN